MRRHVFCGEILCRRIIKGDARSFSKAKLSFFLPHKLFFLILYERRKQWLSLNVKFIHILYRRAYLHFSNDFRRPLGELYINKLLKLNL